jgi:hypothetical protein
MVNTVAAGVSLLASLAVAGTEAGKPPPASVSKGQGSDATRVTLSPEAAERLDIKTALVRERRVAPTRRLPGKILTVRKDVAVAIVQVELSDNEMTRVRRDEPARVLPLGRNRKRAGIPVFPVQNPTARGLYEYRALYYETSDAEHDLVPLELVQVELPLAGAAGARTSVPYAAVLYDATGNTWVYTNTEPLVFIRHPISIETIVGDEAILSDGPPPGTAVVTVGVAELYGAEVGVGK